MSSKLDYSFNDRGRLGSLRSNGLEFAAEDDGTEVPDWAALKAELRQCLESYEVKAFEDCLTRAKGQTLQGQPLEDALAEVLQQASNYDFDSAMATLEGIGGAA